MSVVKFEPPLPANNKVGIYYRYLGAVGNTAQPLLFSGYLASSLGRPSTASGSGTPRPLTGWLWPRG